jgi:exodeoxyribonuclease V alpha subunit
VPRRTAQPSLVKGRRTTGAWMMLRRNLLYTGITRAKKLVVLVGSRRALAAAVRTAGAGRRHTALAHRLSQR